MNLPIDVLDRMVTVIDASVIPGGWDQPHLLVGVDEEGAYVLPIPEKIHPVTVIENLEVPDEWLALGLVTFGWATPAPDHPDFLIAERQRVRVTVLAARNGQIRATAFFEDGEVSDSPAEGRVLDALRKAVGIRA